MAEAMKLDKTTMLAMCQMVIDNLAEEMARPDSHAACRGGHGPHFSIIVLASRHPSGTKRMSAILNQVMAMLPRPDGICFEETERAGNEETLKALAPYLAPKPPSNN